MLSVGNSISIRFAKQIEIIYGPASTIFGADAFSGVINISSLDNTEKSSTTVHGAFGSLSATDAMFESHIKVNDDFTFTILGRAFQSKGLDVVGTDTVFNIIKRYQAPYKPKCEQPINDFNIFVHADYKNFTLGYFRQMFDEGNAYSQNPDKNIYNKQNRWKSSTDNIWTSYKKEFQSIGTLTSDLNITYFKLDNSTQFYKWVTANEPNAAFSQYMTGKDLSYKWNTTLHKIVSNEFEFIAGFDYENIKSIPPYANDELFGKSLKYEGATADSIDNLLTLKENRIAGFGQLIWSPNKILNIVIGGRYDYSSRYHGTFNPRIGVTLRPFEKTALKFVYGTAFQAPSLFFQYEQWGSSTTVMLSAEEVRKLIDPNWQLKNQLVSSYELSLSQQIASSFQCKISAYYNKLTDLIQRVTFDIYQTTFNKYYNKLTDGVRNENIGIQTITGINAELNYKLSNKLETYSFFCYTHGLSKETLGEVSIPRISENKMWIGVTYNNLLNYFTISPRLRWVGNINNSNKTLYPNGTQKGNTSLDLTISANRLFGFIKVYALFNNLLDKHIDHAGLYQQTGGYMATIPQQGINFRFGVEVNL